MRARAFLVALVSLLLAAASGASAQGPCAPQASGLVAYYPFNGDAIDVSGNGNHGTVSGAVLAADRFGRPSSSFVFNGISDYISTPDSPTLDITSTIAVSAWVKLDPSYSGGIVYIADKYWDASDAQDRHAWLVSVEDFKFRYFNAYSRVGNHYDLLYSTQTLTPGEWYHVVAVTDDTSLRIFINGVQDGQKAKTGTLGWSPKDLSIGRSYVPGHYFPGHIDDVRVYSTALSAAAIQRLWAIESLPGASLREGLLACYPLDGNAMDAGGNGNDGDVLGATATTDRMGRPEAAFGFDGIDDYISVPDDPTLDTVDAMTISTWVRLDPSYSGGIVYVADKYWDGSGYSWLFSVEDFKVRYYNSYNASDGHPAHADILYSTSTLSTNTWYHIVGTSDGSTLRLYINGVPAGHMAATGALRPNDKELSIGRSYVGSHYFPGQIDDVRLYGRALRDTEVDDLYVLESSPSDSTPPTLTLPADLTVDATSPAGAVVTYEVSASDVEGGVVMVACLPVAGAVFPIGTTAVNCAAADSTGNQTERSFLVTVRNPTPTVTVEFRDSEGNPLGGGVVHYYSGSWLAFGTTGADGRVSKAMPLRSYAFRMIYGGGVQDQVQDTAANALVLYRTTTVTVQLKNSLGTPLDGGAVQYYAGGWRAFGTTTGGQVTRELLPVAYTFRMAYLGATQDKAQHVAMSPAVVFQTACVHVALNNSAGVLIDGGTAQYYAGSWRAFGAMIGGQATLELLPASYTVRMTFAGGVQDKVQNVGANAAFAFTTTAVHSDSNTCVAFYANGWRPFVQDMELLPATYVFRFSGTPDTSFPVLPAVVNHIR